MLIYLVIPTHTTNNINIKGMTKKKNKKQKKNINMKTKIENLLSI
jgi:hypothetical protein